MDCCVACFAVWVCIIFLFVASGLAVADELTSVRGDSQTTNKFLAHLVLWCTLAELWGGYARGSTHLHPPSDKPLPLSLARPRGKRRCCGRSCCRGGRGKGQRIRPPIPLSQRASPRLDPRRRPDALASGAGRASVRQLPDPLTRLLLASLPLPAALLLCRLPPVASRRLSSQMHKLNLPSFGLVAGWSRCFIVYTDELTRLFYDRCYTHMRELAPSRSGGLGHVFSIGPPALHALATLVLFRSWLMPLADPTRRPSFALLVYVSRA